ncbi:MAG: c-type cytochrome [Burkholderiaceae bacterium]|nr:c-type cytochrome [Burkholderiaceae bacterium]
MVVLSFVVPVLIIVLLVKYVVGEKSASAGADAMTPEAIAERLRPVGSVALAQASGPRTLKAGAEVYKLACGACHTGGVAGAPKTGDDAAWAPRLKQGYETLVRHAVEGFKTMPAKGGNADLDPIEVARAVVHMANASGARFKEPDPVKSGEHTGQQVVAEACGSCHDAGEGGAPKVGDWAAWKPRIEKGLNTLFESAISGHGGMPARGGMAKLTDAEIKRAIEYMFNAGKQAAPGAAAVAPAAVAVAAAAAPAKADATAGKKLYETSCLACHAAGVAGAPKLGDKAAWSARAAAGVDALTATVLKGKGAMPPRGAAASATDAEIRAAVEYMLAQSR